MDYVYPYELTADDDSVNPWEGCLLAGLARNLRPKVILEVGRHRGVSTACLAQGLTREEDRLYSYDPGPVDDGKLRQTLRWTTGVVLRSTAWPDPLFEQKVDFAFIDGDHSYEACSRDMETVWALMAPGGLMVVHDALCRQQPGVRKAVAEFPVACLLLTTDPRGGPNAETGDGFAVYRKE